MISKPAVLTWHSRAVAGTKENGGDGGVEMIIKGGSGVKSTCREAS